jgi:diguanylate cyclase (GGDEF)-like protein/PAS domain S-box-containing protein
MAGIVESLATTGSWHGEISNRHKNGQRYVAWLSIKHVEGSAPGNYVAAFTDITARKQAEMALQASEEKLRGLYELSTMGIALTDMHGHYLEFNESFRNICGYTCEELNKLDYWALTPKEYAEKEAEQLESLKTRGYYGPYEKEYIRKDGTRIPLRLNGVLIHEQAGNSYIWSIVEDISERKQTETQLRITASVFEAAREGITITDPSGNILDVNPAFTRISGYRRDEVLGKRPNMLASGKNDRHFYESMWTTLLQNGVWTGEIVNRRKSGEIYSEHLDIVAVRDATGRVKHYVGIFSDITKLKSHEAHLKHIAHHDSLTGLPNRLLLTDRLSQSLAQAQRGGLTLAVVYLDLDGFKPINDTYGHELGDKVLVEVAHRLAEGLRAGDTVARLGGDEFVILLLGISNIEECEFAIRRLLDSIAQPITLNGLSLSLSASLGISLYPDEGSDDADTLLRYADHAMYAAKAGGRNQFVFYSATTIPDKLDLTQFEG